MYANQNNGKFFYYKDGNLLLVWEVNVVEMCNLCKGSKEMDMMLQCIKRKKMNDTSKAYVFAESFGGLVCNCVIAY